MKIEMDFSSFEETMKKVEKLASEAELEEMDRKIVEKTGKVAKEAAVSNVRSRAYSKDPSLSGRKGSRTGQHAGDNIPHTRSRAGGYYKELIGWEKTDNSPYFYMKFHEFGTSGNPVSRKSRSGNRHIMHPKKIEEKGMFRDAAETATQEMRKFAEKEYMDALRKVEN